MYLLLTKIIWDTDMVGISTFKIHAREKLYESVKMDLLKNLRNFYLYIHICFIIVMYGMIQIYVTTD